MLKKLLKYDLQFVFKYWWIAAAVCVSLSVAGGFCIRILASSSSGRELPAVVESSAISILFLAYMAFIAFEIISVILIFIRFYSNFFSDEGYLTFTLPVKRTSLINSKIITTVITQISTVMLILFCICFMLIIGFWEGFLSVEFWETVAKGINYYFSDNILCRIMYIIEFLLLSVLFAVFSNLFLFCCITLACTITKKARVITSIGIYYAVNSLISFALQIFAIFGISAIVEYFAEISDKMLEPVVCLTVFGVILLFSIFCVILYALQYRMFDHKLNLA